MLKVYIPNSAILALTLSITFKSSELALKFAIGSFDPGTKNYQTFTLDVKKGDVIYLFSDGYADQFGGLKGKKFMYRQFKETLLAISHEPMETQKVLLDQKIEAWRGSLDQIDDILVMGVKV